MHCIEQADIQDKYGVILKSFGQEIEEIKRQYQKFREDPLIPRDMPPISGKIMWARQLFRKIQEPMEVFADNAEHLLRVSKHTGMMQDPDLKYFLYKILGVT